MNVSDLGFTSIRDFQAAWNLGPRLVVDGIQGPKTNAALYTSLRAGGLISPHFRAAEFACHCGGRFAGCHHTLVLRDLLQSLETLRTHTGPLTIVSGYRCPQQNSLVGGAGDSQHMYGSAADIPPQIEYSAVIGLHVFAGIGRNQSTGLAAHVDRRDVSGHNTTGGTLLRPTLWTYPR